MTSTSSSSPPSPTSTTSRKDDRESDALLLSNSQLKTQYFETKKREFEAGCIESDPVSPAACFSLGEWYQLIAEDHAKAMTLYLDNCARRGHSNSCFNLSQLLLSRRTPPNDIEKVFPEAANDENRRNELARRFAKQSCEATRHGQACSSYATMLSTGLGGEKNASKALDLLDSLCNTDNDARACVQAGAIYLKSVEGIKRNPQRAHAYMTRACDDLGHPNGCQVLAVMYSRGEEGILPDAAKSEAYKEKTKVLVRATGEKLGTKKM